jgi:hypothetical protein
MNAVIDATDRSVRAAAKLPPGDATRALIEDAFAGGAGDNIAVALYRSYT